MTSQIETSATCHSPRYVKLRPSGRRQISEIKRTPARVGPFATFYFESYQTMLHQVQEMLFIEKGGAAQIPDELAAYNPLIPQGSGWWRPSCSRSMIQSAVPRARLPGWRRGQGFPARRRRNDPRRRREGDLDARAGRQGVLRAVPAFSIHAGCDRCLPQWLSDVVVGVDHPTTAIWR